MHWHLITSEYPPQPGGVSDYTQLVAEGLATAGDAVHVWCPRSDLVAPVSSGVTVRQELGDLRPGDLGRLDRFLDEFPKPRRLLVQWVPHGYGCRSMNLPFCWWLQRRARARHDRIDIMIHEPYLGFCRGALKQNLAAVVHRLMTCLLLRAASRVWMSIPAWESCWRPYAFGRRVPFAWLPVPSNIPVVSDAPASAALRKRLVGEGLLIGHFGTYGPFATASLQATIPELLRTDPRLHLLLLGRGGEGFHRQLIRQAAEVAERLHAPGELPAAELSRHVAACDLLLQPYSDGVSSRRTSVMVGLSHGVAVVTTRGRLTEPLWVEGDAVRLVPAGDAAGLIQHTRRLLEDVSERSRLAAAGRLLYAQRFDLRHTIAALRAGI